MMDLEAAKKRALNWVENLQLDTAYQTFIADLKSHPDTYPTPDYQHAGVFHVENKDLSGMRRWILEAR